MTTAYKHGEIWIAKYSYDDDSTPEREFAFPWGKFLLCFAGSLRYNQVQPPGDLLVMCPHSDDFNDTLIEIAIFILLLS